MKNKRARTCLNNLKRGDCVHCGARRGERPFLARRGSHKISPNYAHLVGIISSAAHARTKMKIQVALEIEHLTTRHKTQRRDSVLVVVCVNSALRAGVTLGLIESSAARNAACCAVNGWRKFSTPRSRIRTLLHSATPPTPCIICMQFFVCCFWSEFARCV